MIYLVVDNVCSDRPAAAFGPTLIVVSRAKQRQTSLPTFCYEGRMNTVPFRPIPTTFDALEHNLDMGKDIDWGTATPVTRIVNVLDEKKLVKAMSKCALQAAQPPKHQKALVLHGLRQPFSLSEEYKVPERKSSDELVVRVHAIGLNPIDWKSVDYGFGIPVLPYVAGRDFAGEVVEAPTTHSHIQVGDIVRCRNLPPTTAMGR